MQCTPGKKNKEYALRVDKKSKLYAVIVVSVYNRLNGVISFVKTIKLNKRKYVPYVSISKVQ